MVEAWVYFGNGKGKGLREKRGVSGDRDVTRKGVRLKRSFALFLFQKMWSLYFLQIRASVPLLCLLVVVMLVENKTKSQLQVISLRDKDYEVPMPLHSPGESP